MTDHSTNSESNSNSSSNSYWLPNMNNYGSYVVMTPPPEPHFHTRNDSIGFIVKVKLGIEDANSLTDLLYRGKQIDQLIGLALSIEGGKTTIENLTLKYIQDSIKMLIRKYNRKLIEFKGTGGSRKRTRRNKRFSKKSRRIRGKN